MRPSPLLYGPAAGTTEREGANGVYGWKSEGNGNINVDVTGSMITTEGRISVGIVGWNLTNTDQQNDININVQDSTLTTEGVSSPGIYGIHEGMGDINITAREGTSITTKGDESHGIYGFHKTSNGDSVIDLQDISIITQGGESIGVFSVNQGLGDTDIDVRNSSITTESTASVNEYGDTLADGIYAFSQLGSGDIDIDTESVVIETKGVFSRGVIAQHKGEGSINLDIRGGETARPS